MAGNAVSVREAVLALARSHKFEEGHSLQDERLALRLFDETARLRLHHLDREAGLNAPRNILSYAAILHDIGYAVGYDAHHKHAYRMILAQPIPGLTGEDQQIVALVARYHRGALPDPASHAGFEDLSAADQTLVAQLGSILRFADGLDRGHTNAVRDLRCKLDGGTLLVRLLPGENDSVERFAGEKKARFFQQVFGVEVALR